MTALPGVALDASQAVHAAVAVAADALVSAGVNLNTLRPVIAGEDDERVGGQAGAGERGEHLAHDAVHLRDEIAVFARLAAAIEFGRWARSGNAAR